MKIKTAYNNSYYTFEARPCIIQVYKTKGEALSCLEKEKRKKQPQPKRKL